MENSTNNFEAEILEAIEFHSEETDFKLDNEELLKSWIYSTLIYESKELSNINIIFCSDGYLHRMNVEYLNHDTLTDVITFPYSDPKETEIEGDIFISIDRVRENAQKFSVSLNTELYRVIIHGVLHLIGYQDKTPEKKKIMTSKEDEYLGKISH